MCILFCFRCDVSTRPKRGRDFRLVFFAVWYNPSVSWFSNNRSISYIDRYICFPGKSQKIILMGRFKFIEFLMELNLDVKTRPKRGRDFRLVFVAVWYNPSVSWFSNNRSISYMDRYICFPGKSQKIILIGRFKFIEFLMELNLNVKTPFPCVKWYRYELTRFSVKIAGNLTLP